LRTRSRTERRPAILLLNYDDPVNPSSGGAPHYCFEIMRRAVKDGYQVVWISSRFDGSKAEETIQGIRIIRFGNPFSVFVYAAFYSLIHRKDFDVIFESVSAVPFFSRLYSTKPRLVMIHHLVPREVMRQKLGWVSALPWMVQRYIAPLVYSGNRVVTLGRSTAEELKVVGYKDVHEVKAGVDQPHDALAKEEIVVIAGPLRPWKRVEDSVQAFAGLPRNWRLILFGSFEDRAYESQIKSLLSELSIVDRVEILGHISEEDKARSYSRAKIAILASKKEGWGFSIFEPQAYGCGVVAYDVPGVRDSVLNGVTGLLVDDGDVAGLTSALRLLAEDSALRERLASNGLLRSKSYSWNDAYRELRTQLESILRPQ
jgi:glycosyltransferase involved in cell wall biosynthesis